jgi:hypothetical protein
MKHILFVASIAMGFGLLSNGASAAEHVNCWPERTLHRIVACSVDGRIASPRPDRVRQVQCEGEYCGPRDCPYEDVTPTARLSASAATEQGQPSRERRGAGEK